MFLRSQFHILGAQPALFGVLKLSFIVQNVDGGEDRIGNSDGQDLQFIVDNEIFFRKLAQINGVLCKTIVFRFFIGGIPFETAPALIGQGYDLGKLGSINDQPGILAVGQNNGLLEISDSAPSRMLPMISVNRATSAIAFLTTWAFATGFSMVAFVIVSLLSIYLSNRTIPYAAQKRHLNLVNVPA